MVEVSFSFFSPPSLVLSGNRKKTSTSFQLYTQNSAFSISPLLQLPEPKSLARSYLLPTQSFQLFCKIMSKICRPLNLQRQTCPFLGSPNTVKQPQILGATILIAANLLVMCHPYGLCHPQIHLGG